MTSNLIQNYAFFMLRTPVEENHARTMGRFTSKGYRCLCPPEFKGEKCTEGKIVIIYNLKSLY